MQNVILLAVVCVGFFYALYRVYKNSDGTEGSSGSTEGSSSGSRRRRCKGNRFCSG